MCFIYYLKVGMGEVFALFRELGDTVLGILCCRFPTLRCAIHTTSRRTTSAYLSGEGRVVRMTSTSEGSEWEVRATFQACQGTGAILEL